MLLSFPYCQKILLKHADSQLVDITPFGGTSVAPPTAKSSAGATSSGKQQWKANKTGSPATKPVVVANVIPSSKSKGLFLC